MTRMKYRQVLGETIVHELQAQALRSEWLAKLRAQGCQESWLPAFRASAVE